MSGRWPSLRLATSRSRHVKPLQFQVEFHGDGGHAGGQLMHRRNDAGLAGAELALAAEAVAHAGTVNSVATTGVRHFEPPYIGIMNDFIMPVRDFESSRVL